MANPKDILLDESFDVKTSGGDFVVDLSVRQHQQLLLLSSPGEWKQDPQVGVGVRDYLLDDASIHEMHQAIQNQFTLDGMRVKEISGKTWADTTIDAEYV